MLLYGQKVRWDTPTETSMVSMGHRGVYLFNISTGSIVPLPSSCCIVVEANGQPALVFEKDLVLDEDPV